ncbi:MAG: 4-(cytidine 5'-diphospho)-2-C-methyl-D-erythritol kinase [Brumimicrobium sp.]|nr:4-(cytidine 5'-diphospho)-2-C-methyl-D-erythritol kinase [Brumimicrobium sp.]
MISFPNCKINLGLNVLRKRSDGYHDIESVFYPVELNDALEVVRNDPFAFTSSGLGIPGDPSQNLCVKAYEMIVRNYSIPSVRIHLLKNIPMGGGLGGGSSNGAFTLKLLNDFFELNITEEQLLGMALELGSDCPFFIKNKPQLALGRGEILSEVELSLKGKHLVLVNDGIHISTAQAFASIKPSVPQENISDIILKPPVFWKSRLKNDFEPGIFSLFPQLSRLKDLLYDSGALYASMTGTGSTVYGIFDKFPELPERIMDSSGFVRIIELN